MAFNEPARELCSLSKDCINGSTSKVSICPSNSNERRILFSDNSFPLISKRSRSRVSDSLSSLLLLVVILSSVSFF